MMKKILIIEDEPGLVLTLTDRLRAEGYSVISADDGNKGLAAAKSGCDAIILDVMLPGKNGFDVCRDLRAAGVLTPILMLTARGQVIDKVLGLKLGADDYLTKPFDSLELVARLEALLRRSAGAIELDQGNQFVFGEVHIDFRKAEVRKSGKSVELSAQEFRLLRYLVAHRGATLSRDELMQNVWGYDDAITTRTIDVHVGWLRQKLEDNPKRPKYIQTIHGLGYKLVV